MPIRNKSWGMVRRLAVMWVTALVLVQGCSMDTRADGIPIVRVDAHAVIRENSQLAYITVQNESQERLELFINVISLHPGENMTVVVPLRTPPSSMTVSEGNDRNFTRTHRFREIKEKGRIQNNNLVHLQDTLFDEEDGIPIWMFMFLGGFGALFSGATWSLSFDGGNMMDYSAQGFSVDLRNFSSEGSLEEFYDSLGINAPMNVEEIIDRYSEFNIAIINFTTRAPIDEGAYGDLQKNFSDSLTRFEKFLEDHPTIIVQKPYSIDSFTEDVQDDGLQEIYADFLEDLESHRQANNLTNNEVYWIISNFNQLVAVAYGYGTMEGYAISLELPLHDGKAFFPLGTTPAWNGIDRIEVIFQCDDNHSIELNRDPDYEVIDGGNHYYVFSSFDDVPDYDLEGNYVEDDLTWKVRYYGFNTWVHDHSVLILFVLTLMLLTFLLYRGLSWWLKREEVTMNSRARGNLTAGMLIGSLFIGPFYGSFIAFRSYSIAGTMRRLLIWELGPANTGNSEMADEDLAMIPLVTFGTILGAIGLIVSLLIFFEEQGSYDESRSRLVFWGLASIAFLIIFAGCLVKRIILERKGFAPEQRLLLKYVTPVYDWRRSTVAFSVFLLWPLLAFPGALVSMIVLHDSLGLPEIWSALLTAGGLAAWIALGYYLVKVRDVNYCRDLRASVLKAYHDRPDVIEYAEKKPMDSLWGRYISMMATRQRTIWSRR